MARWVELQTLDFCSGHGLAVCELEPPVGLLAESVEPAWNSLSLSLSLSVLPPTCACSLSLKINFKNLKKIIK